MKQASEKTSVALPAPKRPTLSLRKLSIRSKLIILMLTGTSLIGAITLVSSTYWSARLLDAQRNESIKALAHAFHQDFERILWLQNPDDAADTVTRLESFDYILSATLYNSQNQAQFRYRNSHTADHPSITFEEPLTAGKNTIGRVDFVIAKARLEQGVTPLIEHSLWLLPAIILLSILFTLIAQAILSGPILQFTRRISALRTNPHQQHRLPDDQSAEIGKMYAGVNALLDSLQDTNQELINQKRALDEAALVIGLNLQAEVTYRNSGLQRLLGPVADEWQGQTLSEVFDEASCQRFEAWIKAGLTGQINHGILVLNAVETSPYGEFPITLACTLMPILCPKGNTDSFLIIGFDITEQKQLEEQLRTARLAALQAAEAKSLFLANMSHEIRTPMNGVMGMCELLLDESLNTTQTQYAQTIQRSADSLLHIINDILDISKIEANRLTLENTDFNPQIELDDVCLLIKPLAQEKGLDFALNIAHKLPNKLIGDPTRLRQVLINLLGNAVKFTERGSVSLNVAYTLDNGSARLSFSIDDTGIGMSEEAQQRIFDRFEQADASTTRQHGGTGLGLAISLALVELMGGYIEVRSERGKGSQFYFDILLQTATTARLASQAYDSAFDSVPAGLRVLVAEDERVNRMVASGMLKKLHCEITLVENGQEALDALDQTDFDVILMDCQMPVMDGLTATTRIRGRQDDKASTPIIALTANASKEDEASCLAAGMDGFVSKPVKIAMLAETLLEYGKP